MEDADVLNCEFCELKFKRNDNLRYHLAKVHNRGSESFLKCEECEYVSNRKEYLEAHMIKVHGREVERSMRQCDRCEYRSVRKENLLYHLAKIHGILNKNVSRCDECDWMSNKG